MSSAALTDTYSVAIEGFSAFERNALASFFRLAAERTPAYHQVEEAGLSDFLIADADHAESIAAVRRGQRERDTVFIGARAPHGTTAWLPRPIDPMRIVRALDGLIEQRLALPAASSGPMPLGPIEMPDDEAPREIDVLLPEAGGKPPLAAVAEPRGGGGREVLVVDDSSIARQFLKVRLLRLGYRVQTASSGEQALELIERQSFALAFLDVVLGAPGSVDGLQLCQAIKHRAAGGGAPCAVLLVTSLRGSSDRVRGSLAGCDAYLTKPLLEAPFVAALQQVDPDFEWDTAASV